MSKENALVSLGNNEGVRDLSFGAYAKFSEKLTFHNQPAVTCSKLTIETLEQGVKYVQS